MNYNLHDVDVDRSTQIERDLELLAGKWIATEQFDKEFIFERCQLIAPA